MVPEISSPLCNQGWAGRCGIGKFGIYSIDTDILQDLSNGMDIDHGKRKREEEEGYRPLMQALIEHLGYGGHGPHCGWNKFRCHLTDSSYHPWCDCWCFFIQSSFWLSCGLADPSDLADISPMLLDDSPPTKIRQVWTILPTGIQSGGAF